MDGCRGGKGYFGTERNVLAKPDGGVVGKGERGEIFPYGGCAGRDDGNGIYMENRGDRSEDKRFCGFAAADFGGFVVGDHFGHGAAPVAVEEIASNVILGSINQAIAFNFPGTRLRLGFYHQSVKSEEQLSSGDRVRNS